MATAEQNFDALTLHIDSLDPDSMKTELGSILGASDGRGALSGAIVRHNMDPANPNDPMIDLLETIRSKLGQDADPSLRSALGKQAVKSIASALFSNAFKPGSLEYVAALADEAEKLTEFIDDPEDRSDSLFGIASVASGVNLDRTDNAGSLFAVALSSEYLDKAAKAGKDIEEPVLRSYNLHRLAEHSIHNLWAAAIVSERNQRGEELPAYVREQPARLYREAFAATDAIEDPSELYFTETDISGTAISLINAICATQVKDAAPDVYEELVTIALSRIDRIIADSKDGRLASLDVEQQAYLLSDFGKELVLVLGQKYYGTENEFSEEELIAGLEERAFTLFRTALEKMQTAGEVESDGHFSDQKINVLKAARVWVDRDIPKTKELIDIAFGLAEVQAANHDTDRDPDPMQKVVSEVRELARQLGDKAQDTFKLYRHTHALLDEREASEQTELLKTQNARNWIRGLRGGDVQRMHGMGSLDETGRSFVMHAVGKGSNYTQDVILAGEIFRGDAEIVQAVDARVEKNRAEAAKNKEPKSQTERLARELIQSL
jgi:hypothetical protein